ncbi:MAG: GNAT family N-acetyltransferase [Bacilli bacterium]|nr:GNAT family N-acetyltransferase [Bacilli bacterium]
MIHLEKIDWDNYEKVLKLHVAKDQEDFVARNDISLIHAFLATSEGEPVFAYAIYNDDTPVGFIQMGYDDDWSGEEREDWLNSDIYKKWDGKKYYFIWRFMIDKKYQGKGYGREALKKAIEFLKTEPCGKAEYITLSYERTNEVAKKLYFSLGFYEPKEFEPYYEEDDEIYALLKL